MRDLVRSLGWENPLEKGIATWASPVAQSVKNLPAVQETRVWSLGWEDPRRRKWQPTPVSLPGKSHGQRSLVGCSPWGRKESGTYEQLTLTYLPVFLPREFHEQRSLVGYSPWGHKEWYTTEWLTATHRSNFTSPMLCTQELTKEIISSPNLNI